jgi:hypothetical protein
MLFDEMFANDWLAPFQHSPLILFFLLLLFQPDDDDRDISAARRIKGQKEIYITTQSSTAWYIIRNI